MEFDLQQLSDVVQFNCDVADANFAGNYTMCTYLLKMRELYRWSESIEQSDPLLTASVSSWVQQKEAYWESLENLDFRRLPVCGREYEAFDVGGINQQLAAYGLVYGAGYGRGCRPEFYLGSLDRMEHYDSYDVLISGYEYARDLSAPVAMSQGERIYVRQESIRRMLWEQIEAWRWQKSPPGALQRALQNFPLESAPELTLEKLLNIQMDCVINHEVGEVVAGSLLGEEWADMLVQHSGTRLEIVARAIRDHLADVLVTLPALMDADDLSAIHLYFANLNAMRRTLFPQLLEAYGQWCDTSSLDGFKYLIRLSHVHWLAQSEKLLDDFRHFGDALRISDNDIAGFQPTFALH
ncbi:MAG: hypothetical protein OQL16_08145, partial [Gammaproteobacteria bacterium]|nr:hypothetical protein [Gammaproteobacteria bacterium]